MTSSTLDNGRFYGGVRQERHVAGLTLAETGYGPGFVVPPHDHRQPFFCLGLRGTFTERMEGRSWTAKPTTVFYHPAGAEHAEEFGGRGGRLFNVQLGADWLARLEAFDLRPPRRQVRGTGGRLSWIATNLFREFRDDDTAADLSMDGLALALLAHVIRTAEPRIRGTRPGWLSRVEDLMHDRVGDPVLIADLAAEVEIHPVHLARVFRRHHGCSPGEYLRRLRVRRACALLAETDESLAAVAYATGYADQSHFTRQLKRALGVTPGQYRRLVR
ncbi:MAG: helix-turn-helix domain-containing protein [Gemmatimonadetes bacterium]|nr:helix-turn-helix transcriptional regulator [Gemmatimonadota bacterium]NIQ54566.1 helix-turn-helix transcriptional regulator [Gemmatimonadota bacterium]NIU74769.1 helix-turn-helix domain-containing protein [Gammaproteobacteria bacterium]NIX44675.1 helix-turn-helix domain-containing protein [Gemmatimonadota bacterium]NIY08910.1 helix-turn-helix domain-containing protein [Gemmatimonadota bacterium]